uniref:DnaJ heat shock protein family (Hsp40) member C17 n=1 Tax=Ovis aries TaxID=9940 RepID=A0AC11DBR5_SHEEP
MAVTKELLQMDLYALLGIEEKAEDKEVKKAYRQKALSCHPDKNPDNPRAAELFHQLSQALEVLTDAAARAAYDKVRKARKQAAERTQKLDERRKKVKLDLEARERQAQALGSEEEEESGSARTLEQEIERLREEGSRQLEEQQRLIREQIRQEQEQRLRGMAENPESKETPKLKLKWKSKKEAESQGGYSRDVLLRLFQKYGEVLDLVLSSKKAGTAVVEFATVKAAVSALWGFGVHQQPCHSRGGTQFCGPSELRCPHSLGQLRAKISLRPTGPRRGDTVSEGMNRRMFQRWCHFLLPGSTPLTLPWKPVCLQVGTFTEPSPLPYCLVRRLTFPMRRVRASAHHCMKAAPLCLEDERAGSGSFCRGRENHCVADWNDGTGTGCCI